MITRQKISYDPITGATVTFVHDVDAKIGWFETEYDTEIEQAIKDVATALRNDGRAWERGVKQGWAGAAMIPPSVRHQWRTEGLDPDSKDPDVQKRINQLLNGDYKYLKVTSKKL